MKNKVRAHALEIGQMFHLYGILHKKISMNCSIQNEFVAREVSGNRIGGRFCNINFNTLVEAI